MHFAKCEPNEYGGVYFVHELGLERLPRTYISAVLGLPMEWLSCVAYVKPFAKISCYAPWFKNVV